MWQIVHGTYFERVGRGVIPHGPGSVMDWTQAQAESYGLERLRKVAQEPVVEDAPTRRVHISGGSVEKGGHNDPESQIKDRPPSPAPTKARGRPRKVKDASNAATSKRK